MTKQLISRLSDVSRWIAAIEDCSATESATPEAAPRRLRPARSHAPTERRGPSAKALRPQTPIKNFYLSGQDIVTCGIGGALFGGVLTASAITKRNVLGEILERTASR